MKPTRDELSHRRKLTPFQVQCQHEVENLLRGHGIEFYSRKVDGEGESYLILEPRSSAKQLKIYIYEDEAGFFQGSDWHIWETPDHSEPQLLARFLARLRLAITEEQS